MRQHSPKHQESKSAPDHQYVTPRKTGDLYKQLQKHYVFQNPLQRMRTRNWMMMIFVNVNMRNIQQRPELEVHLLAIPLSRLYPS